MAGRYFLRNSTWALTAGLFSSAGSVGLTSHQAETRLLALSRPAGDSVPPIELQFEFTIYSGCQFSAAALRMPCAANLDVVSWTKTSVPAAMQSATWLSMDGSDNSWLTNVTVIT